MIISVACSYAITHTWFSAAPAYLRGDSSNFGVSTDRNVIFTAYILLGSVIIYAEPGSCKSFISPENYYFFKFQQIPTRATLSFWRHYLQRCLPKHAGCQTQNWDASGLKLLLSSSEELAWPGALSDDITTLSFSGVSSMFSTAGSLWCHRICARGVYRFRFRLERTNRFWA